MTRLADQNAAAPASQSANHPLRAGFAGLAAPDRAASTTSMNYSNWPKHCPAASSIPPSTIEDAKLAATSHRRQPEAITPQCGRGAEGLIDTYAGWFDLPHFATNRAGSNGGGLAPVEG